MIALVWTSACRGVPVVDVGSKPPIANGTIAGIVRGPEGTSAVSGRTVQAVNIDTGLKRSAVTIANGGFTIEVPPGKYRLELALHAGESLTKSPGIIDVGHGDIDSHIEFVLASSGSTHPRARAYRIDNGLGSPIA